MFSQHLKFSSALQNKQFEPQAVPRMQTSLSSTAAPYTHKITEHAFRHLCIVLHIL